MNTPLSPEQVDSIRSRRVLILTILAWMLTITMAAISLTWLYLYNINMTVAVVFVAVTSCLSVLGSTHIFSIFCGAWVALSDSTKDRLNPQNYACDLAPDTRVAALVPIYHEDARRVCASIAATIRQMEETPEAAHFDWFVLSDSRRPDIVAQEQFAVYSLNRMFPQARIAYRHRGINTWSKVGNTSDFVRRWGDHYKFMVIYDADATTPADTLIRMARTMEGNERIGILSGVNYETNSKTLFGRITAWSTNANMVIGAAAQYFFRPARCGFYGHGAIVRVAPFRDHCNLPVFDRMGPFDPGKPSSHDFPEAVLLQAQGYETWRLWDLPSFDDQINNMVDNVTREQRWTYGALNWYRLFMLSALTPYGKFNLVSSVTNYFNATAGLVFFLLSYKGMAFIIQHPVRTSMMLSHAGVVITFSFWMMIVMMSAPFLVGLVYHHKKGTLPRYGGVIKYTFSYILSLVHGWFTAPGMMIVINQILFRWLTGIGKKTFVWASQNRTGRLVSFVEAWFSFRYIALFGLCVLWYLMVNVFPYATTGALRALHVSAYWVLFWLVPPVTGLIFFPLIARLTSVHYPMMEKMGWLKDPYESDDDMPPEGRILTEMRGMNREFDRIIPETWTMDDAIRSFPFVSWHLSCLPERKRKTAFWLRVFGDRKFTDLSPREKLLVFRTGGLWRHFMNA